MRTLLLLVFPIALACSAQVTENISFMHEGLAVNGTFAHPGTGGPYPTVLLMPGTGANDRDITVTLAGANAQCLYPGLLGNTLKPFRDLSDALVAGGFAVLRYDKVEYTYPDPAALGDITFTKLWLPAISALDHLRTRNDVDAARISLVAHSEGSTLAPHVALQDEGISAIVSLAGPRAPLDSLLARQLEYIATTCGGDVQQAIAEGQQVMQYFAMIRAQQWTAQTPALFGVPAPVWHQYIQMADAVAQNYSQTGLPTLFLGMQEDFNVPPVELQRFQNELGDLAEYGSFPGLNHFLTNATQPIVSELVTDSVVSWLTARMNAVGIADHAMGQKPLSATATEQGLWITGLHQGSNEIVIHDAGGRIIHTATLRADGPLEIPVPAGGMVIVQARHSDILRSVRVIIP